MPTSPCVPSRRKRAFSFCAVSAGASGSPLTSASKLRSRSADGLERCGRVGEDHAVADGAVVDDGVGQHQRRLGDRAARCLMRLLHRHANRAHAQALNAGIEGGSRTHSSWVRCRQDSPAGPRGVLRRPATPGPIMPPEGALAGRGCRPDNGTGPHAPHHTCRSSRPTLRRVRRHRARQRRPRIPEQARPCAGCGQDARRPRDLHPAFYGSFDWHSCVHMHWLLARVRRLLPDLPQRECDRRRCSIVI